MSASEPNSPSWHRSTLSLALVGSGLLWAALPPLGLAWLGWIAPVPWLILIARTEPLAGRRPYRALYLAGLAFWLPTIHWLRLPHPLVYFGWIALSAYLALYLPVFVGLSRVAVHRLRVPLWLAAPTVWAGLELARAHVMTGFMMGSLAHTQYRWLSVIQLSDALGEYGVDFLMMLVAAGAAGALRISDFGLRIGKGNPQSRVPAGCHNPKLTLLSLLPAAVALSGALVYGQHRVKEQHSAGDARTVRIALIQGNTLADWKLDEKKQRQIMDDYIRLSFDAVTKARGQGDGRLPDLIVWPETMFRVALMTFDADYQLPRDSINTKEEMAAAGPRELARFAAAMKAPVLVGIDRIHFGSAGYSSQSADGGNEQTNKADPDDQFIRGHNSAVLVGRDGQIVGTYDKVHLVMFGEYVPFARKLRFLARLSPLTGDAEAGEGPVALCADGVCYAPNICYETVIPHVIRRQVTELAAAGKSPDVLVNVTNDAWYWGSSELTQHLACDVFRAIETRTPLVIAANGGISAWIDHLGKIRAESPKQQADVIIADVELNRGHGESVYMRTGDWFAGVCLACCVLLAIIGWKSKRKDKDN